MLHAKIYPSRWRFLGSFLTASKPSRRSITAAKRKEKEKKERRKKIPKIEKPKDVGHFLVQNFDFCACPSHNALKRDAGGKKGKLLCCKRIFDRIKGNLAEIQPKNHQNVQKTNFLQKIPGVNGLNTKWSMWKANLQKLFPLTEKKTVNTFSTSKSKTDTDRQKHIKALKKEDGTSEIKCQTKLNLWRRCAFFQTNLWI